MTRVLRSLMIAAFAIAIAPAGASAQAVYGSLSGTVTDSSGGALPGVTVTVTSIERATVDSVVTNESGLFTKDRLLPGTYEVKARAVDGNGDVQTSFEATPYPAGATGYHAILLRVG